MTSAATKAAPIIVAASAALVGAAVPLAPHLVSLDPGLIQALFLITTLGVGAASCVYLVRSIRAGSPPARLASTVVAFTLLLAVGVPGAQELAGARQSITADLGFPNVRLDEDIGRAYLVFLLSLGCLVLGETFALTLSRPRTRSRRWFAQPAGGRLRGTYGVLVALGLMISLVGSTGSAAARGTITGQGITDVLRLAIPMALAVGVLCRHWGSRWLVLLDIALAGLQLYGATRTPFLIVGIACLLRFVGNASRRRGTALRLLAGGIVFAYVAAILVGGISAFRGAQTVGDPGSLVADMTAAARDPLSATGAGADTLDGLVLATKTDRSAVQAHWYDLDKTVLGFIPHQLWASKPTWLGSSVTHYYTNFGGLSGIFLSGAGYGYIVFGGLLGMMLFFVALGGLIQLAYQRVALTSVTSLLLTYFVVRFTFGGDAFDTFHVLTLVALLALAAGIHAALERVWMTRVAEAPRVATLISDQPAGAPAARRPVSQQGPRSRRDIATLPRTPAGQIATRRAVRQLTVVASNLAPIGGMERAGYEITRRLADRGWDVTVIARSNAVPNTRFVPLRAPSRPVSLAIALSYLQGSLALARHRRGVVHTHNAVVANRVDVVTVQFCESAYRERVGLSRSSRSTLAFRLNSWLASGMDLFAERHTYGGQRARCLVPVSRGTERELRQYFDARTTVIANGVDRRVFAPDRSARTSIRAALEIPEEVPVAIFMGGDWHRKGLIHAIDGVARARHWHLIVVGRGDIIGFSAAAQSRRALDRVRFTGPVTDPQRYFAAADALVFPSNYEAFSLVTLEAAASGLALLAQRINGTEELVDDGVNGYFVAGDGAEIAVRLDELATDRATLVAMGEAARKSTEPYSWEAVVNRYEALLTSLAERT